MCEDAVGVRLAGVGRFLGAGTELEGVQRSADVGGAPERVAEVRVPDREALEIGELQEGGKAKFGGRRDGVYESDVIGDWDEGEGAEKVGSECEGAGDPR